MQTGIRKLKKNSKMYFYCWTKWFTDVVQIPEEINSPQAVERLKTRCSKEILFYAKIKAEDYPPKSSFRDHTKSVIHFDGIFLHLLIPNSSLLDDAFSNLQESPWVIRPLALRSVVPNTIFTVSTQFDSINFVTCAPNEKRSYHAS